MWKMKRMYPICVCVCVCETKMKLRRNSFIDVIFPHICNKSFSLNSANVETYNGVYCFREFVMYDNQGSDLYNNIFLYHVSFR